MDKKISMHEMWQKQQVHEHAKKMYSAEIFVKELGNMEKATFGRPRYGKKKGRSFDLVQKVLGLCETENGTKNDELLEAGASGHKEQGNILKRIHVLDDGRIPAKEARNWKIEGQKRRTTRKEYRSLWNDFEMGGFMAQKGLWNVARKKMLQDREEVSRRGNREGEKGEEEQVVAKRRCGNPVSGDAFNKFSHGEDSDSC